MHTLAAAHYNMGVCYFQLGDYQSSINSFQESLKLSPHHADVHTNIASAHIKLNSNLTQALSHLQAAANIAPQDSEIQVSYMQAINVVVDSFFFLFFPRLWGDHRSFLLTHLHVFLMSSSTWR